MKDKKWIYYNPTFESEKYNPMMLVYSPWTGHKRFAYDYMRFMEPSVVVELGSYYGCSAFSFLQAIKDGELKTSFYAIDTWAGDDYTQNDYKEDIYGAYKSINDKCFSETDSTMLRMTFDEACPEFEEKSIDLLHIDGSHSYEDVKHDYLTWKDKVKDNGVIFFHDVGEDLLFGEKMGSHIFWEELKKEMPFTMEFGFSNGLGILFKNEEEYLLIKNAMSKEVYQSYINLQDTINKDELRKGYFSVRDLEKYNSDLKEQIEILNSHLEKYSEDTNAKQSYIDHLVNEKDVAIAEKEKDFSNLQQEFDNLKKYAEGKETYAAELETQIDSLKAFADEKEKYALELEAEKAELSKFADEKNSYAENLVAKLAELNNFAEEKSTYVRELEKQLVELKTYAEGKANYVSELEKQIKDLSEFASGKDRYASELEQRLSDISKVDEERESSFRILQKYASDMENNLNQEIAKLLGEINIRKQEQDSLYVENAKLQAQLEQIKEKLKRLPFGSKLLKGIE